MSFIWEIVTAVMIVVLCGFIMYLFIETEKAKSQAAEMREELTGLTKQYFRLEREFDELRELMPKDNQGEVIRHELLLKQLNDEMENSLRMEQEWNKGLQGILSYGKPIAGEDRT